MQIRVQDGQSMNASCLRLGGIFIVEFWWTSNIGMATSFLEHGLANCASVIEDIALDRKSVV